MQFFLLIEEGDSFIFFYLFFFSFIYYFFERIYINIIIEKEKCVMSINQLKNLLKDE